MTTDAILDAVRGWSVEDKLALVDRLWDQIPEGEVPLRPSPGLVAELNRRIAAYKADPTNVYTWDEVVAHIRRGRD